MALLKVILGPLHLEQKW